jgi:hypothetical protein
VKILGIDPGTDRSGVVMLDTDSMRVLDAKEVSNEALLGILRVGFRRSDMVPDVVAIEDYVHMGQMVGKEVFETCKWIGRFREAWESVETNRTVRLIKRTDEKTVLCGGQTYMDPETKCRKGFLDSHIRRALIERFPATGGGKTPQVGLVKNPGPLFGISGHLWSALAVAMTCHLIDKDERGVENLRG